MLDLLLIALMILLVTRWLQMKPFFWKNAGIPYTIPIPIFGNTFSIFYKSFYEAVQERYKRIGDSSMLGFHFFGVPTLLIGDPNLVKKFTVSEANSFMSRGYHTNSSKDPISRGLFFTEGEQWKVFRQKMTPFFTRGKIKLIMPLIEPTADTFVQYLASTGKSGPVNVHEACVKFTIDVTMSTIFGLKPNCFENPNSFFFNIQRELISFSFGFKVLIGKLNPRLYNYLGLTALSASTTEKMERFISDVIDQRLSGIGVRPDFLQSMVDQMKEEKSMDDDKITYNADGTIAAKFDRFNITGQCMLMYLASTDIPGNAMSFLLYELARNPEIQNTARQEIMAMLRRREGQYNFEDLHELHYVNMVIKETTRMYPVIMINARKCTKKFNFNGVELPVGSIILIPTLQIQRDPRYFPDPDRFVPERFCDESNIPPGAYTPFGIGPRACIGVTLTMTEITLCLCKLLPKYKLTLSKKSEVPLKFLDSVILSPKNGIWLNVEKIN